MKLNLLLLKSLLTAGIAILTGCSTPPEKTTMAPVVAQTTVVAMPQPSHSAATKDIAYAEPLAEIAPMEPVRRLPDFEPKSPNATVLTSYDSGSSTAEKLVAASPTPFSESPSPTPDEERAEVLQSLQIRPEYTMGPGDVLRIVVVGDDQITGTYTIGPDGKIGIPMAGVVLFAGSTREKACEILTKALEKKLDKPSITININEYHNNHVFVLGRVQHPGQIELDGEGRLLQALATAGIQATGRNTAAQLPLLPPRCAIIRGNQQALWIDLQPLMTGGDLSLNVVLRNNDLVFLPDVEEQFVYVMGSVTRPGAVPFKSKMSLLDALAVAGGVNTDGRYGDVIVSRRQADGEYAPPQEFDVRKVMEKGSAANLELLAGDVVFVRRSNMAKVGLFFQRIAPGIEMMSVGANLLDTFHRSGSNSSVIRRTTP